MTEVTFNDISYICNYYNFFTTGINDIKEDTKALTNELFSSNKTNDTETNIGSTAKENIMWSMLMRNNRLFSLVLNRRRSVLYLIGTGI
jgi:hypothetical protein